MSLPPSKQSAGEDPTSSKRNSGLFAFFKWFKSSASRESINSDLQSSDSSSCDSLSSVESGGTVASFSFVPPNAYANITKEKTIAAGPETDTYKARLKQRDKRRENDKNLTLRKKYNLFFNRETLLKNLVKQQKDNTKSLPLMTKTINEQINLEDKGHRRTNSDSSKTKKAGAYLHVKGKRRAPQPPQKSQSTPSTMSLKRKKRLAPPPPEKSTSETIIYADADVICNDSLALDRGVLKPLKNKEVADENSRQQAGTSSARSSFVEAPVSPRPWYKRHTSNKDKKEIAHKKELPETQIPDLTLDDAKEANKKRKSGISYLANISELDREAAEIIRKEQQQSLQEMPEFMRPRQEAKPNTDSWVSPKRRSARDLIAKFNAITSVTKVTVFGAKESKKDYFGKQHSLDESKQRQESMLESHKKRLEQIDKKNILMKSESANAIKVKPDTPKLERKSWVCPKCNVDNDYWRIICHVCSNIKPYFDDFYANKQSDTKLNELKTASPLEIRKNTTQINENPLERSKTQIGFSALATYNNAKNNNTKKSTVEKSGDEKREEKEKLKKMLIEMKNSLPKRKSNMLMKQNSRASIIMENPEQKSEDKTPEGKTQEQQVVEILIGTSETIYENIKVKKTDNPKPIKVSSSAQTSAIPKKLVPPNTISSILKLEESKRNNFELMRPKDFEDIYSDKNSKSAARIYANMAQSEELSLFFNVPKKMSDLKSDMSQADVNTDTIEINRLLRRLETAIAKGDLTEAASFAKELAHLKVNCSVVRQKNEDGGGLIKEKKIGFQIEMYVEDKISHRGPFPIQVTENQTVAELKQQIEKEFEIPADVQRWILGKELVTNDNATLKDHKVTSEGCPVFLYLVAPDAEKRKSQILKPEDVPAIPNKETNESADKLVKKENELPKIVQVIPKVVETIKTENTTSENTGKVTKVLVTSKSSEGSSSNQANLPVKINEVKVKPSTSNENKPSSVKPEVVKSELMIASVTTHPPVLQHKILEEKIDVEVRDLASGGPRISPKKAVLEEDFDEYKNNTLTPKEWECCVCTLLNPVTSSICNACSAIRVKAPAKKSVKLKKAPQPQQTYQQLMSLDNDDLVENNEVFECLVCFTEVPIKQGVTLRECLHQFCKECLAHTVEYSEEAEVKCPYRDSDYSCNIALQDREIKALVRPEIYDQFLAKSITQAENKTDKSFHCKTPDCKGWCIFEDNVNEFRCPVCRRTNCLTCQAIHMGENCKQYQERVKDKSENDEEAKRTKEWLEEMVNKGEALTCPTCKVVLMKKWGCDWLRCSMCKTEICWVTRGPRWGPAGKGDTSGGCQCGLKGIKCHPKCNYCH